MVSTLHIILLLLAVLIIPYVYFRLNVTRDPIPARSVSRQDTGATKQKEQSNDSYRGKFPHFRHHKLEILQHSDPKRYQLCPTATIRSGQALENCQLPTTRLPDTSNDKQFTPTGFSLGEIKALKPFPDYAVLSGVPNPKPCPDFNIETACFRPFRPFRWGYHQTMSLSKLDPNFWIELDRSYFERLHLRRSIWEKHGSRIMNLNAGAQLAARELMEMVIQYTCIRYPHLFSLESSNTVLNNRLLGTKTDLTTTCPLKVLFENIPEDFAIMLRNQDDGMYYLRGGIICSSIGWDLGLHFNKQLKDIHEEVQDYKEKMSLSMDRFFSRMATDQPIQRGSWNLVEGQPIYMSPQEYANKTPENPNVTIEECNLRVDFQTLRRLPLSGAIVFNFKVVFTPVTNFRTEPYIPSLLRKQISMGDQKLMKRKVLPGMRAIVLDALEVWEKEQIEDGIVSEHWEVQTLDESPFYPGWKERHRSRVGFDI